jgi:uncharacterized integral membrane protein
MRVLSFLFLIVFVAAIVVFSVQNNFKIHVNLFGWDFEAAFPLLAAAVYMLGMLTGWAVVGMLRRSWRRVAENTERR